MHVVMLAGPAQAGLGDIRADLQRVFALLGSSGTSAAQKFDELIALIRSEAEKGALQAVPTIKLEVKKTVTPYLLGAFGLGGLGVILGIAALRRARR